MPRRANRKPIQSDKQRGIVTPSRRRNPTTRLVKFVGGDIRLAKVPPVEEAVPVVLEEPVEEVLPSSEEDDIRTQAKELGIKYWHNKKIDRLIEEIDEILSQPSEIPEILSESEYVESQLIEDMEDISEEEEDETDGDDS